MTIALHVMVKNGKDKLPALFESVKGFCDSVVVLDTGSTDGTLGWLETQKILPCQYITVEFIDFGRTRTLGMKYAKGMADWLLLLDDDMRLVFTQPKEDVKNRLTGGIEYFSLKHTGGSVYWVTRLVRGDRDWQYKGVTHEYLDGSIAPVKLEGVEIDHQYNHGPEKFERDLRLLSADIARDPYDSRTIFYLAQTLRDMRHTIPAIHYYELRARMGGWAEEVFYSCYEAARLAEDPKAMQKAFMYRPSRAEAPYWLAKYYKSRGEPELAAYWERIRKAIPMTPDILFVHTEAYE
jgi:glycosyltransferase involved in cell wall biosynthesis